MANGVDLGYNEELIEAISQYYPNLGVEELNELIEATNEKLLWVGLRIKEVPLNFKKAVK